MTAEQMRERAAKLCEEEADFVTKMSKNAESWSEALTIETRGLVKVLRKKAEDIRAIGRAETKETLSPSAKLAKEMREGTARFVSERDRLVSAPPSDEPPEPGVYPNDGHVKAKKTT